MQLSRADALLLSKVLFWHSRVTAYDESPVAPALLAFAARLDGFLTSGEVVDKGESHSTDVVSPDDDDVDDEDEDEDEGDPPPPAEEKISPTVLHDMPATDVDCDDESALLEFEEVDNGVDVLFAGSTFEGVSVLRRTGKTLEIWAENDDEGLHVTFEIKKLSKACKLTLKDGVVYEVS